jgi:hypothetical protein
MLNEWWGIDQMRLSDNELVIWVGQTSRVTRQPRTSSQKRVAQIRRIPVTCDVIWSIWLFTNNFCSF